MKTYTRTTNREWFGYSVSHPAEYSVWGAMKQRCVNPKHPEYENYGARGISVCDRWLNSFSNFLNDMGARPENGTLDRIDNNGSYEPSNCRWVTQAVQNRNKRETRMLTYGGKTQCLTDWANELGIHHQTLRNRLKRGWSDTEALSTGRIEVGRDGLGRIVGR